MRNLSSPLDLPGAGAARPLRGNSFVPQGYPDPAMPAPVSSLEQLKRQPRQPGEASFFYYDPHFQLNSAKVLPGEYFVSRDEMAIVTVLGSCIAACLWDRFMRIGGMNHFMLPDGDSSDVSGRYGSYAMELLINEMLKLGARRESMQAKIFGGAQVMANFTTMNVGERNTSFVTEYLQTERIPIVSEDVLDIYPRKVVFFPSTGKAMVKRLAHAHPEALVQQEITRGNAAAVARNTAGGSVDLF
ncbi:Chemoreceptor glutamine deamidase CheD [Comamonas sp. PE63]|uniref:Probable chemoreceptor glutamine deamidase CheD n=1 Tax=Comamonas brasiliensis TaxID=1812482 RepID=A0ABS5M020_9BURK|nr:MULTISPECIES: chemoreceptor glutamine deamidase CheD [Comamonas]ACY31224.1 CheD [Comamonas thiooxydans]MBL5979262.1 chemoreceptor glutamine deamidase CheD [Comamonas sp. NyZ500]MBS3022125.1 Chemoreceptor glutamine deamidase CheD [Comamonas sp. PE63]MDO1474970.1 chemoreceptor glutamine deamidase CheD [Comamonas thiooxydans]QOQ82818.1 chemoreceptor glutamine deamidase CheD [Comamonas thiooxydans]